VKTITAGNVHYSVYTDAEIEDAWADTTGQGNRQARLRNAFCVVIGLQSKAEAIELSHLFVGSVFAIPTCTHWNGETLSLYVGDAGGNWRDTYYAARYLAIGFLVGRRPESRELILRQAHTPDAVMG